MTNEGQGSVPTPQHAHGFPTQQTNRVRVQIITSPSLAHTLASGCSQKLPACVPSSIFPVKYANKMCSCAFNKDYVACRLACCSAYEAHRKDNPLTKIRGLTTHSALENRRPLRLVAGTLLLFWWALSVCQFGGHWHCWRFAGGSRKGNQIFRYHHFFPRSTVSSLTPSAADAYGGPCERKHTCARRPERRLREAGPFEREEPSDFLLSSRIGMPANRHS